MVFQSLGSRDFRSFERRDFQSISECYIGVFLVGKVVVLAWESFGVFLLLVFWSLGRWYVSDFRVYPFVIFVVFRSRVSDLFPLLNREQLRAKVRLRKLFSKQVFATFFSKKNETGLV